MVRGEEWRCTVHIIMVDTWHKPLGPLDKGEAEQFLAEHGFKPVGNDLWIKEVVGAIEETEFAHVLQLMDPKDYKD